MISRVTQAMIRQQSITAVDGGLTKLTAAQLQLETGKKINVPSDDPTGTVVAMKSQAEIAAQQQYQRNANDGLAWLGTIDGALTGIGTSLQSAYTLAVQASNTATLTPTSATALAEEIDSIKQTVLSSANTQYLGRPVFGGTTTGSAAYAEDADTGQVTYTGNDGTISRRVGANTIVPVSLSNTSVFGPDSSAGTDVFTDLSNLSAALRSWTGTSADTVDGGAASVIQQSMTALKGDIQRVSGAQAQEGAYYNQITTAKNFLGSSILALQQVNSDAVNVDVAQATINLQTQSTAYQAALAATGKTAQQSLLDYLS